MRLTQGVGRTAHLVAAACMVLTIFVPLNAYGAERVALGEYFNGTW